ncbi:MAG: M20/M25/M40 family metallo-hydrolase [Parvularculaceae bacterium]
MRMGGARNRAILALLPIIAGLLGVASFRAMRLAAPGGYETPATDAATGAAIGATLADMVRLKTISRENDPAADAARAAAHAELAALLRDAYPNVHRALEREVVGDGSLAFRWLGPPNTDEKPIALLAHLDVTPADDPDGRWSRPPFSGEIVAGAVWGRGTLDDKGSAAAILHAVERLLEIGVAPSRDVYLLFGHDEEVGGEGARAMAALLERRGVRLAFTLDEGSGLVREAGAPVALIAVAEKGYATLKLSATGAGGHSSTPRAQTAVSRVARAVSALTDNPYPIELDANGARFLRALARERDFVQRFALGNLWLMGGLAKGQIAKDPPVAAFFRTTTAATVISGGVKSNVLPTAAEALVNFRLHPRDAVDEVLARAERLIDDPEVTIELVEGTDPSPTSSTASAGYRAMVAATRRVYGDVATAPALTIGATDTRHYVGLADDHYRFLPFVFELSDLRRIHGVDERVSLDNLARAAAWYEAFLREAAGG